MGITEPPLRHRPKRTGQGVEGAVSPCPGQLAGIGAAGFASLLGMSRDPVKYIDGIPRWFTYLIHLVNRPRCWKAGHDGGAPGFPIFTCLRCGLIMRELPERATAVVHPSNGAGVFALGVFDGSQGKIMPLLIRDELYGVGTIIEVEVADDRKSAAVTYKPFDIPKRVR